MTLITLGPAGTFSHELALHLAGDVLLVPTIGKVFQEVLRSGNYGLVPLENSEAGGVAATLDGLMQNPVYIIKEAYMPIHHTLASDTPLTKLHVIYAHPQSHEQCSSVIEELGIPVIHTSSNAESARLQKENPGSAAIISEKLAGMHTIPVLQRNIENNPENITRFVQISPFPGSVQNPEKCSILIDPEENHAGLLYELLWPLKQRSVNMTRIESRPSKRKMGRYVFFIDLQCEGDWKGAIEELDTMTRIKHLGCYTCLEGPVCSR